MMTIEVNGIGTKEIENTMTIELDGEIYDEAAVTTDNALVVFDEATADWVQLWRNADEVDYTIVNE